MIKTFRGVLTAVSFLMMVGSGLAQEKTNAAVLSKMERLIKEAETLSLSKAVSLARQKGWPLIRKDGANNTVVLVGVDAFGMPVYLATENNAVSAATIGTNRLWNGGSSGLNLTGSDASVRGKLAVWDGGKIRDSHVELTGRILTKDNPQIIESHSTHVAGTMIAKGINPLARGMAFNAQQLIAYDFNNHMAEMTAEANPGGSGTGILLSNHSYGTLAGWSYNNDQNRWEYYGLNNSTEDYKFGYYNNDAQIWDSIAYNAPYYLIVKSSGNNRNVNGPAVGQPYWGYDAQQNLVNKGNRPSNISSNDGYDIISTYGTAKNVLTVGAVNPIPGGYSSAADVVISPFSSWGPTDDGRIKPDVVADGVDVLSTYGSSDNAYGTLSGTSMASPAVAGSLYLLQEYYARLHGGSFMRSATLKGLIIHTADEAGPAPGPDYKHGWGLVNMEKAAAVITSQNTDKIISELTLTNGNTYTTNVAASGTEPLVVTLCWTDPKGDVNNNINTVLNDNTPKLVHDLDVRMTMDGTTYYPWILTPTNPSAAATKGINNLDNVEKIEIPNPVPGATYTITVSHKNNLARWSQAFSLIVSGVNGNSYCSSTSQNAGPIISQISFGGQNYSVPAGCTNYAAATSAFIPAQPSSQLPFAITLGNCNGSTGSSVVKIFVDFNNNGNFDDAGELVGTSAVITTSGNYTGTISIPAGVKVGSSARMRIVVMATNDPSAVTACGSYNTGATYDYFLSFTQPANDLSVMGIEYPTPGDCPNPTQRVSVRFRNTGTTTITNVPITVTVKNGATQIVTQTSHYVGRILPGADMVYTAPLTFNMQGQTTYTIEVSTSYTDQVPANNSLTATITSGPGTDAPTGTAVICTSTASLQATSAATGNFLWYGSSTSNTPLAVGSNASTSTIPGDSVFYLAVNDYKNNIGPTRDALGGNKSYAWFSGVFSRFTNTIPITIESFRIYSSTSGKAKIIVADIPNYTPGQSYSYTPISSTEIDVQRSRDPLSGTDTGYIYQVNLPVNVTGDHAIIINLEASGTDPEDTLKVGINSGLTANPYPIGNSYFRITSNNNYTAQSPTMYQQFFFMTYDMTVKSLGCASERTPILATQVVNPVITQNGNVLTSNIGGNLQWYRNNEAISGATGISYTIVEPGNYHVMVNDGGCVGKSNTINALVTAVVDIDNASNGLMVSPNPNNGHFTLKLLSSQTGKLQVMLYNAAGQAIFSDSRPNFSGVYQKDFALSVPAGVYMLKIQHGSKSLVQKLIINPN